MRENLPESGRGDIGAHEAGHAMKQLGYQPYLDFIDQAPDFVDQSTREAGVLMEGAAQHLGIDLFDMSEQDTVNLFDEINNIVYGAIHAGRTEILELVRPAFFDFDTYAAELSEIHEQFKRERRGTKTHESRKGFSVDRELDREIRQIVKEAREGGKSEDVIQADIRALVQESYQRMAEQYGTIPTGERPVREVRVPRKTAEDKKVSQTVRTILEAGATPETAIPNIEELTARGAFSYTQYTDKQAMKDAEGTIRDKGYASALSDWTNRVRSGEVSKRNTAEGWVLYNNAANSGDMKSAMTILTNMVEHQRNAAQAVQATRILKQLPPDVQLYGVARSVRNLQEELTRRYGKNAPDLKIDEKLAGPLRKRGQPPLYSICASPAHHVGQAGTFFSVPGCIRPSDLSQQDQDQPIDHAGTDAEHQDRTGHHEQLGRRSGDEPLAFKFQGRGYHGVCKAGDGHQGARPRPLGHLVKQPQTGEQGRRQDQRHRNGGPRLLPVQSQALIPLHQPLPHNADPTPHAEGPYQVLPQRRGLRLAAHQRIILLIAQIHLRSPIPASGGVMVSSMPHSGKIMRAA